MTKKRIKNIKIVDPGSPPDVDTDLPSKFRDEVVLYTISKYGKNNVARLMTPGPFKSKNAWKSMCTINGVDSKTANRISELIDPSNLIADYFYEGGEFYEEGADLRLAIGENELLKKTIEDAIKLNSRQRELGVHACGLVLSKEDLSNVIPQHIRQEDNAVITQFDYYDCEALGLIKMDYLGLNTLDIIQETMQSIKESGLECPTTEEIIEGDLSDKEVFKMFQQGNSFGIFQFSKPGVRQLLKEVQPTEFNELAAITALYRPGPMGMKLHTDFAKRKNDVSARIPIHKAYYGTKLEEILKPTLGACVYQEQIILIATQCAGFTSQEGDALRKAMGKKKADILVNYEKKFKDGLEKNGYTNKEANNMLWSGLVGFSAYAFNKCLHGEAEVVFADGKKSTLANLYKEFQRGTEIYILSRWEDGSVRPHKVKNIVDTGFKPCYEIITKKGRSISLTKEHRMLTSDGYKSIESGLSVGDKLAQDKVDLRRNTVKWRGRKSEVYKGIEVHSSLELALAEYLDLRGIPYQLTPIDLDKNHPRYRFDLEENLSIFANDLGVDSVEFARFSQQQKNNYMVDPYGYLDQVDEILSLPSEREDFDEVVQIIPPKKKTDGEVYLKKTYDIEMEIDGPSNFIANGLVSHNSHSVSYALNSYQAAYLKVHFPVHFMATLLRLNFGKDDFSSYCDEANRLGIKIIPPDVNVSNMDITPTQDGKGISYGLGYIKRIGNSIMQSIIKERVKNGLYKDLNDFLERCPDITASILKHLAVSGCLDSLNISRKECYEEAESIVKRARKESIQSTLTNSLFTLNEMETAPVSCSTKEDWSELEKLAKEAYYTGMFLSGHPLDSFEPLSGQKVERQQTFEDMTAENSEQKEFTQYIAFMQLTNKKAPNGKGYITAVINNKSSQMEIKITGRMMDGILAKAAFDKSGGDMKKAMSILGKSFVDRYCDESGKLNLELYDKPTLFTLYKATFKKSFSNKLSLVRYEEVKYSKNNRELIEAILNPEIKLTQPSQIEKLKEIILSLDKNNIGSNYSCDIRLYTTSDLKTYVDLHNINSRFNDLSLEITKAFSQKYKKKNVDYIFKNLKESKNAYT